MQDENGRIIPDLEPLMEVNAFSLTKMENGIRGVAKRINNLLFQKKGTCLDDYNMGVDIQQYRFDRSADGVIGKLQSEITDQINTYIDDVKLSEVQVEFTKNNSSKNIVGNSLFVKLFFSEPIEGSNYLGIKVSKKPSGEPDVSMFIV